GSGEIPLGGINVFGNGFLPNIYQPSFLYPERPEPLQDITPKEPDSLQRKRMRFVDAIDREYLKAVDGNPQVESAIQNYETAFSVDQPIAGLIQDLKARGLFDQTLIIWSGEFGRAPFVQGSDGRDHNPYGFSLWLAGGGVKGGTVFGATDEYGYRTVEDALTVY